MKPILFNTDMVKAILDGRKTVTRRVVKPQPSKDYSAYAGYCQDENKCAWESDEYGKGLHWAKPPYRPGDVLYVRETWQHVYNIDDTTDQCIDGTGRYVYYADGDMPFSHWIDPDTGAHKEKMPWKPSIHMPKEAARIFLKVINVRVERLQEITEEWAVREGVNDPYDYQDPSYYEQPHMQTLEYYASAFAGLWDSTIKKQDLSLYGWHANPWVWVIEFERITKEEAKA